ncbi:hypothetical protein ACG0Z4_29935, partial [Enterocloster aldenensis]|uniref:hypothetical protein n=1 Tax=Enterocloster aldenensis TaxID=358742 RepID=UPI004025417B
TGQPDQTDNNDGNSPDLPGDNEDAIPGQPSQPDQTGQPDQTDNNDGNSPDLPGDNEDTIPGQPGQPGQTGQTGQPHLPDVNEDILPGKPNDILEEKEHPKAPKKKPKEEYTFCGYFFSYSDWPLEWLLGDEFDAKAQLPDTVELYVDGPDGHIDESIYLDVEWDLGDVDFTREGEYPVTGILDTSACPYDLDWDDTPLPSMVIVILSSGTMSFQPEADSSTLALCYTLNGHPFQLPILSMELYESLDNGANWRNITQSSRVRMDQDRMVISGIYSDSLFQATRLKLSGYNTGNSDIVEVTASDMIQSVTIIPSQGIQGGEQWNADSGSIWDPDPVMDGPYQIVDYKTGASRPFSLDQRIEKGNSDWFSWKFHDPISVYYGDAVGGFWKERILLPVEWDRETVDSIDWNQIGDTVIQGHFSDEIMEEYQYLLDFDHMPGLSFTISVYSPEAAFFLYAVEEKIFEDQTVRFQFYNSEDEAISLDDTSKLRVWCSLDGRVTWYDITDEPNVTLTSDSLSVSHLNRQNLSGLGYTFQVEQSALLDRETYSSTLSVYHDIFGINFGMDVGGDRGGGKRQEKPPKDMFDAEGSVDGPVINPPMEVPPAPEPSPPSGSDVEDKPDFGSGTHGGHGSGNGWTGRKEDPFREIPPEPYPYKAPEPAFPSSQVSTEAARPAGAPAPARAGDDGHKQETHHDRQTLFNSEQMSGDTSAQTGVPAKSHVDPSAPASAGDDLQDRIQETPPRPFWSHTARTIAGASALLFGGIAGFWMIRRR